MLLMLAATAIASPQITAGETATFQGAPLVLRGTGFGSGGAGHAVVIDSAGATRVVQSSSPLIGIWTDTHIALATLPGTTSGAVRVVSPLGSSPWAVLEVFAYSNTDLPPDGPGGPLPLALAVDDQRRVWVNEEFHTQLKHLDITTGAVTALPIPVPAGPGPFASTLFGDFQTTMSGMGEDILVDPYGTVWFTQGGGYLYNGVYPNHSRVVAVEPDAVGGPSFRVYNAPGDWNEVIGVTWDANRDWIWVAAGGMQGSGGRIAGFDPALVPWDNQFDFSTSLAHLVGTPGDLTGPVYHVFDVPGLQPAHLLVAQDGTIWYTAYWGSTIGRLDPVSGQTWAYPVSPTLSSHPTAGNVGPGPWKIVEAPNGDILFSETFDATVSRFDATRAGDPLCTVLDGSDTNPCITDLVLPDADHDNDWFHSIAFDGSGRLWFTWFTDNAEGLKGSLGYIPPGGSEMVRFPPLSGFDPPTWADPSWPAAGSGAGIATDAATGDMWFCEFWAKRLGRLQYVPPIP